MYVENVEMSGRNDGLRVWLLDRGVVVVSSGTVVAASYLCSIGELRRWAADSTAQLVVVSREEEEGIARAVWRNAFVDAVVVSEYAMMFLAPLAGSRTEPGGVVVRLTEDGYWLVSREDRQMRCESWDGVCAALVELV